MGIVIRRDNNGQYVINDFDSIVDSLNSIFKAAYNIEPITGTNEANYNDALAFILKESVEATISVIEEKYNINLAKGFNLDRLCRDFGITRLKATKIEFNVNITVDLEMTLSIGDKFIDVYNNMYELQNEIIYETNDFKGATSSTKEGLFKAVESKYIKVIKNQEFTKVIDNPNILTILSKENAVSTDDEEDDEFRSRFKKATRGNHISEEDNIINKVLSVKNVVNATLFYNASDIVDSIGTKPNHIAVVVEGGDDNDIAQAIFDSKNITTRTSGSITVTVQDKNRYNVDISFYRYNAIDVMINIKWSVKEGATNIEEIEINKLLDEGMQKINIELKLGENIYKTNIQAILLNISYRDSILNDYIYFKTTDLAFSSNASSLFDALDIPYTGKGMFTTITIGRI